VVEVGFDVEEGCDEGSVNGELVYWRGQEIDTAAGIYSRKSMQRLDKLAFNTHDLL
jgi:hypothetical protein